MVIAGTLYRVTGSKTLMLGGPRSPRLFCFRIPDPLILFRIPLSIFFTPLLFVVRPVLILSRSPGVEFPCICAWLGLVDSSLKVGDSPTRVFEN